ncbi:MAG: hypothetical protein ACLP59_10325 [Bryobacteraceae bacterium]
MFDRTTNSKWFWPALLTLVVALAAGQPAAAQSTQSTDAFINAVETSVQIMLAGLPAVNSTQPLIYGGQNIFANGMSIHAWTPQLEIDYVDGLKAANVQRLEFNPAVTTIQNSSSVANMDATVFHARQLGMMLAINPEFNPGELTITEFSQFQTVAIETYPALAARYQPDIFVIVHEPTTQAARMGITTQPSDWIAFIQAIEPLIKKVSPHTLVGSGDCSHCNEDAFFQAFAAMPNCTADTIGSGCLDRVSMDMYSNSLADFAEDAGWAETAHANNKIVYMEETWAPHDLPPGAGGFQSSPTGAEGESLVGSCDAVFVTLDQTWLSAMTDFDQTYGMESITPFTTQAFFLYVDAAAPYDEATNSTYLHEVATAISTGTPRLTPTGTFYSQLVSSQGIRIATSINNASYATLPTIFNQTCGTAGNPCNPNSTVSADMIVSTFGGDLANTTVPASNWGTTLGGTTVTLVDSSNATLSAPIYSVSPNQVNFLVPSNIAPGPAVMTVTSGDKTVTTGVVLVEPVAPGFYTYFANGQGTASAVAVCVGTCSGWTNSLGNNQYWQYTFTSGCTAEPCAAPLTWGADDSLVIELYGTGVRHLASQSDITASIGNTNLQVQFAGSQGNDAGLDQVNLAIPSSLHGAGNVAVSVNASFTDAASGNTYQTTANPVTINLQ